jgi:hypothetical protein
MIIAIMLLEEQRPGGGLRITENGLTAIMKLKKTKITWTDLFCPIRL